MCARAEPSTFDRALEKNGLIWDDHSMLEYRAAEAKVMKLKVELGEIARRSFESLMNYFFHFVTVTSHSRRVPTLK